jgi:hypothetical protein
MLVFIDESGDPGLKLGRGSSPFFCVALVMFEENEEAEAADRAIVDLRSRLRLHEDYEFHFNSCNREIRESFLMAAASYNFFYHGIIINKAKLTGPGFRVKESFYKYTCALVFENAKPRLSDATVIIDGSGSRDFRKQLATYLRRKTGRLIKKVKVQNSRRNNLLQLADMVAGAINRSFGCKADRGAYRQLISHRELRVQFWPRYKKEEPRL